MKFVNVRELKNNPSESLRAARHEPVVVMNRDTPEGLLVSLNDARFGSNEDLRSLLAIALYRDRSMSLARAARVAGVSLERFMEQVSEQGVPVLVGSPETVDSDLDAVKQWKKRRSSSTPGR